MYQELFKFVSYLVSLIEYRITRVIKDVVLSLDM
jgi:hypothetical protein